jgi:hypothetical protein
MGRTTADILTDLAAYAPCPAPERVLQMWGPVLRLIEELEAAGCLADSLPEVIGVFERAPTARMVTSAWDIEYALYRYPGQFERPLVESLLRRPSDFTVRVLCRMLARGSTQVGPWSVVGLLEGVAERAGVPDVLRSLARRNVRWHREDRAEPLYGLDCQGTKNPRGRGSGSS